MRELTAEEIQQVGGGSAMSQYAAEGGALGTIIGGVATNTFAGALRGGAAGAFVGAVYGLSYEVTSWALDQVS